VGERKSESVGGGRKFIYTQEGGVEEGWKK
jgi:hypothetical protein